MSRNGEKTRYTDEELDEFRILIKKKLARAKEQLEFYLNQLSETKKPAAKLGVKPVFNL